MMHTYTIREISELFSLPASTLRYYESEGAASTCRKKFFRAEDLHKGTYRQASMHQLF